MDKNEESPEAESTLMMEKEIEKIVKDYEEESKKHFHYSSFVSSIFYLTILFIVGLPIWYHTTTPERWSFPDISPLIVNSQKLAHYYKISIVFLETPTDFETADLRQYLQVNYSKRIKFNNNLSFIHEWTVRLAFKSELFAFESVNLERSSNVLNDIDQKISANNIQLLNSIMFYILPKSVHADKLINVGRYRSYFVDLNHRDQCNESDLVICIADKINQKVESVQFLVEHFYLQQSGNHEQNIFLLLARNFDFLFDIIYEEDEIKTDFDLEERKNRHRNLIKKIEDIIKRFYTNRFNFSQYFRINFITQVLHFVFPNKNFILSKLLKKNYENERLLPLSSVASILNRIESSRVEHDNEKSYHLVLYVTSSLPPLKFYNRKNNSTSNLITTPFRGSILILNEEKDLLKGFKRLIRSFFCLPQQQEFKDEFFVQLEIESMVRSLVHKNIFETLNSLESIKKLSNKVSNMVIKKKIAQRMHDSLEYSMKAIQFLENGDINQAYDYSWNAYRHSEKAFYDPSLLSLLYFPEDQKYAIYLPLFLPVFIPLLYNIHYLFKILIGKSKNKSKQD